jgi:aldehyde dehydrogenase (NAD+)
MAARRDPAGGDMPADIKLADMKRDNVWLGFVDGAFAPSLAGETLAVADPATGRTMGAVALARRQDVDRAVAAARKAVSTRAIYDMKPNDRGRMLQRIAASLRAHAAEAAMLMTLENGKSISFSNDEIECTAQYFEFYAGMADKLHGRSIPLGKGYADFTQLVPYGVSAQVIPWNFPLELAARSVAPALAAGNAVVIKSPEVSPLTLTYLALASAEAGVPGGYVNLLCGYGDEAGDYLVSHPDVNHIVFTGSVATGRSIMMRAAQNIVPAVIELGGKSAGIMFADADLDATVPSAAVGAFANAGQVCSAGSRLIVERPIFDEVVERLVAWTRTKTMGPGVEDHWFTPVVSERQRDRVEAYCHAAVQSGGKAVIGGRRAPDRDGYFIEPTIFAGGEPDMLIHREAVFGGGDRDRQRHRVRSRGGGLFARSQPRAGDGRAPRGRQRLCQSMVRRRQRNPVRRLQEIGLRSRKRRRGDGQLRSDAKYRHQALTLCERRRVQ